MGFGIASLWQEKIASQSGDLVWDCRRGFTLCQNLAGARIERLGIIASFDESDLGLAIDWGGCDPAINP
jgi:hypothetical protein